MSPNHNACVFLGFEVRGGVKPCELLGSGCMDVDKPYKPGIAFWRLAFPGQVPPASFCGVPAPQTTQLRDCCPPIPTRMLAGGPW